LKLKGIKKITGDKPSSSSSGVSTEKKRRKRPADDGEGVSALNQDLAEHGGWWSLTNESEIADVVGRVVAIETEPFTYLMALDNGRFVIGAPHPSGEGPSPEEILTLIKPPDANWIALKSGYGKYLSIEYGGIVSATSDAIGGKERWEIVFQDDQTAVQAYNGCFLSYELNEEGFVCAKASKAREKEIVKVRTNVEKAKPVDFTPAVDKKNVNECEISYIKMYQHSKVPINPEDRVVVKRARDEGDLHEVLLDRREKMKADRHCK